MKVKISNQIVFSYDQKTLTLTINVIFLNLLNEYAYILELATIVFIYSKSSNFKSVDDQSQTVKFSTTILSLFCDS